MGNLNVLVTGASGFVGKSLCQLMKDQVNLLAVVRDIAKFDVAVNTVQLEVNANTNWQGALKGVDVIVHLAGRAHVMHETADDVYHAYASINIEGTKQLLTSAINAGVKRFIFISSSKVVGEYTERPMHEMDDTAPQGPYADTKAQAESLVREVSQKSDMDYVIIRPPLIYGEGVKANFETLMQLSQSRWPWPLGAIHNQRSLVYLENLTNFIALCMRHPAAANETFFVTDGEDVSTTQLLKLMNQASHQRLRLLPLPMGCIKAACLLLNRRDIYTKLCGDFQLDITKAKTLVGWQPPFSLRAGIQKTISSISGT